MSPKLIPVESFSNVSWDYSALLEDIALEKGIVSKIYDNWNDVVLEPMVDYGGGEKGITVEMMSNVGIEIISRVCKLTKREAKKLQKALAAALAEEPYA